MVPVRFYFVARIFSLMVLTHSAICCLFGGRQIVCLQMLKRICFLNIVWQITKCIINLHRVLNSQKPVWAKWVGKRLHDSHRAVIEIIMIAFTGRLGS